MISILRRAFSAAALGMSVLAVGCGAAGDMSFSPTAPSSPGGTSAATGAVISGTVNGGTSAFTTLSTQSAFATAAAGNAITVSVSGTGITASTDGQGRFTLSGIPAGDVSLTFSGAGANATVTIAGVQPTDRIEITVRVNGREGKVESERRHKDNNRVEVNGRITALDAAARTFNVGEALVRVPEAAVIRHGSRVMTFADLAIGNKVEVKGTRETTGVVAQEVKVEQGGDDDGEDEGDDDGEGDAEAKGTVSALGGTCPAITFTVTARNGTTTSVTADASTDFHEVACSAIANGTFVEVKGVRQANGSILARKIETED